MGRKRHKPHRQSTHISETEEREKIKESILKVFRARLTLPDQGGALVVGPSKLSPKPKESQTSKHKESQHGCGSAENGYSSDRSSSSMSGQETAKKKKQSTVKRRKYSSKSKHKLEKGEKEASSAVAKHMKIARGVSYSLRPGRDGVADTGITNMITHSRITQPVGLINPGKKSAPVSRVPIKIPDLIRKQTEEKLKKILENDDDRAQPSISLIEAQRILSNGSRDSRPVTPASAEMKLQHSVCSIMSSIPDKSPNDQLDIFTEVVPLKETVTSLMASLKTAGKQMYPGRNCLAEVTEELLKLIKQNAPRSATPTPIPVLNRITSSGSVQRKLLDQFPPENSGGKDKHLLMGVQRENSIYEENNKCYTRLPQNIHHAEANIFQPVKQNTSADKIENTDWQSDSLHIYRNSRPQPDHNLKLLANVLDDLHKSPGKKNISAGNDGVQPFDFRRNPYCFGLNSQNKENYSDVNRLKSGSVSDSFVDFPSEMSKTEKPIYILKKYRASDNLQRLYENARLLQKQHRDPRDDIRNELFKEELDRIFASSKSPERQEDAGVFLGNNRKDQSTTRIQQLNCKERERTGDFIDFLGNNTNDSGKREFRPVYEPMEVDNKIWELDSDSLLQMNDLAADMRNQTGYIGNSGDYIPSFLQTRVSESQSQSSSQCSHCSCNTSSRYSGSQQGGDILSQVATKETEYMPSFHGGYYRDQVNPVDLIFEQRGIETQLESNAMDILDYIDSRADTRSGPHSTGLQHSEVLVGPERHPEAGDHPRRQQSVIPVEIPSPDEPKLYPRKMY